MARIFGGRLAAREGAYFKQEQEAAVQLRRRELQRAGKLAPDAARLDGGAGGSASASAAARGRSQGAFEVGMEILQQQARIDDPDAWVRKQRSYRVRGEAPMPSDGETMRARRQIRAWGQPLGHMTALSMSGRGRFHVPRGQKYEYAMRVAEVPSEGQEAAQRAYRASLRALLYGTWGRSSAGGRGRTDANERTTGSALGCVGLVVGVSAAAHFSGIRSVEDLQGVMKAAFEPLAADCSRWVAPLKGHLEASAKLYAFPAGAGAAGPQEKSEFSKRLAAKFGPGSSPSAGP